MQNTLRLMVSMFDSCVERSKLKLIRHLVAYPVFIHLWFHFDPYFLNVAATCGTLYYVGVMVAFSTAL